MTRKQRADFVIKKIDVSFDNGRTFRPARGANQWKFRMETGTLPAGPQPVLVRAEFANGMEAVRRVMLYVDTTNPQVDVISPQEKTTHRDNILVYGVASDNNELANVVVSLRPYHKFFYEVPPALRGLYFDAKTFGATIFDVGLGLSLFKDNVRFQFQYGIAPPEVRTAIWDGGRLTGNVFGIKLLANIFYLPFDFLFGPDWAFYSMNFAIGANFSWFGMDSNREPVFMSAVVGQWDVINIDMQFFYPNWKYFRKFAIYLSPELWFLSSDVESSTPFRMTVGIRINWF